MSYDLNFWKCKLGVTLAHQQTYENLSDGQKVDGLEDLPIERMLVRIEEVFSDWEKLSSDSWKSKKGAFQVFTTAQFLRVDCYGMDDEDINKMIDIAGEFDCPLYDPQVGTRFDGG